MNFFIALKNIAINLTRLITKSFKESKHIKPIGAVALVAVVIALLLITSPWSVPDSPYEPNSNAPEREPAPKQEQTPSPEEDLPAPQESPTPTPSQTPEPIIETGFINPLTGLPTEEDISRNRPVAISLSNIIDAVPMNGVSKADILYEFLVEGGITRMLGIFQDYSDVAKAGSIRSIRHYTVQIAASYDAILLASGGSEPAIHEVSNLNVTCFLEGGRGSQIFYRDRNRIPGRSLEGMHSVVTTGERMERWFPELDIRLLHEDDREQKLTFSRDVNLADGSDAQEVVVKFSGKSSTFTYNSNENVYYMRQFNRDFIDANNNTHVSFSNIIVIKTSVTALTGPYAGAGRRDMVTTGRGEGYFIHGGKCVEINWSRPNLTSQFVYTLKNGAEIELGRGKTYIGIIPNDMSVTLS